LEDQIALGEIEDKGLDHLQHITWGQIQPGETMRQRIISKDEEQQGERKLFLPDRSRGSPLEAIDYDNNQEATRNFFRSLLQYFSGNNL